MAMKQHQHGTILVTALFVMLLLMIISVALLQQQSMQQVQQTLTFYMLQGQWAAYSGKEWAVDDVLLNNAHNLACNNAAVTPTLNIENFQVSIVCSGDVATFPNLRVTAETGTLANSDYIKREMACVVSRGDGSVYCQYL